MRDILRDSKINFVENLRKYLIVLGAVFLAGVIMLAIFGVELDINFKGGSRFSYSYVGELSTSDVEKLVANATGIKSVEITESTDFAGTAKRLVVSISEKDMDKDASDTILKALNKEDPGAKAKLEEAVSVGASIAGTFFAKSLFAVLLAAALVIVYIGIRFRKIGGFSAGIMALIALFVDVLVAFFSCVIFRLEIDSNFMAVVLTIFGYSLNDTVVIYDRIREERKLRPDDSIRSIVNDSINRTLGRTISTSIATLLAVLTVVIVAEFFGLDTLRSFAIPMSAGIISGALSSICLSGPLWVVWCEKHPAKK